MTPSASTKTSPFLGASIGIALWMSTAESFSIGKSHLPPIHQQVDAGTTGLQAVRQWKTSLPYLNYENIDFGGEPSTNHLDDPMTNFALVPETHQRLEESMYDGWEGLNEIYSSPSAFSLGWSFFVPNGVSASFLDTKQTKQSSPLVLTPATAADTTSEFLRSFLQLNQKWVDERILEYGGIVFRGFGGTAGSDASAAIGKEILRAFGPSSGNHKFEYYMVSDNTKKDSQPKPLPSVDQRAQTVTNRASNPSRISEISARTRLTDWRGIHDALPVKLVKKLHDKQLLYQHTRLVPASRVPPEFLLNFRPTISSQPSSWSRLFGSTNNKAFERAYRKLHGERAFSIQESQFVCDAFRCHPLTNEKIWFELAHKLHWTSRPAELVSDFARTKNPLALVRAVRAVRAASLGLWRRLRPRTIRQQQQQQRQKSTTTVAFGDGTPVSWWEMHQIRRAIRQNTARHAWKPGDFLVVDGLSMGLQN